MTPEQFAAVCLVPNENAADNDSWYLPVDLDKRIVLAIKQAVEADRRKGRAVYAVIFGNYSPAEVDSLWADLEGAQKRAAELGSDWRVVDWLVHPAAAPSDM